MNRSRICTLFHLMRCKALVLTGIWTAMLLAFCSSPAQANPVPYSPLDPLAGFWVDAGPILFEAILLGALLGLRWYLVLPAAIVANLASFFVVPLLLFSTPLGFVDLGGLAISWVLMGLLTVAIEAPIFSGVLNRRIPFSKSIRKAALVCLLSVVIMDAAWMLSMELYHSIALGGRVSG